MRRREFIALIGAAAGWPLPARAQQSMPVIGLLGSASPREWGPRLRAFHEGLAEAGYAEGRNVRIEYRWAEGNNERLPALASEFVAAKVAAIVVLGNTASTVAAKAATAEIPIVFRVAADPVELGFVKRMNQPGGNLTGVTTLGAEVGPKQLELLHELVPSATVAAALVNPSNTALAEHQSRAFPEAARRLGLKLHLVRASSDDELDAAFATLRGLGAEALVIASDAFFNSRNERIAALALRHRIPTASPYREFAEAGGLMGYGGSIVDASRQAGVYTGRILNGEKPGSLPVLQATKLEFVLNLKTAKTLGITVPLTLQAQADEAIE
ncbi:MAG TPA: ABC transporter substrate-binding protein [Beijerinckiaceae bacterium]|jgi:putative ABC transport system substrate-binding protein